MTSTESAWGEWDHPSSPCGFIPPPSIQMADIKNIGSCFVFSGKNKIRLRFRKEARVDFLYNQDAQPGIPISSLQTSIRTFFRKNHSAFSNKKVGIVIPDPTRDFHSRAILKPIAGELKKITGGFEFMISLGLHQRLSGTGLMDFLGEPLIRENQIVQHSPKEVIALSIIHGVPATLNRRLFSYDVIITVGVVEPHLYAGFSGGVKCLAIGLAGQETILHTHSPEYISQKGVRVSNIRANPFQHFLWEVCRKLDIPVYSLNLVNNQQKEIAFYSMGEARRSFTESVKAAREIYSYRVRDPFDLLFVGCDSPKDRSLYQASRLFNYVLEKKRLIKKGGIICVFAGLNAQGESQAEKNFESLLKKSGLPDAYGFRKPGEHRTYKVIEASRTGRLCFITPNIPKGGFPCLIFFGHYLDALNWAQDQFGKNLKVGVIPSGFSFIPCP